MIENIDWKFFRFPLTLNQLKMILSAREGASSRLSILPIDKYLTKLSSNLDRFQDGYYRFFESHMDTDMELDELLELIDQLEQVDKGLIILPVEIKSGALQKPYGSIVLLGLGKFSADRKQIVPIILVGQVGQASLLEYKQDLTEEPVISTVTPET